ncbi:MAG: DUF1080 domain-containing protein [Acidobacteria bacterium]|nr:DUF1080 domain-containing protein [Acidobacteriota bacterium]
MRSVPQDRSHLIPVPRLKVRTGQWLARTAFFLLLAFPLLAQPAWQSMFDGATLGNWRATPFAGAGPVSVKDQSIHLVSGPLTGVTWTKDFPTVNYELRLEAQRVSGRDFFAGITFPYFDTHCTWINGGWGGTIVGLSSLDGMDASENETSFRREFESGRWYKFWLRVTPGRIHAFIDGEAVIDIDVSTRAVSLRDGPIDLSRPLGIAAYYTTARLRNIEYRPLPVP